VPPRNLRAQVLWAYPPRTTRSEYCEDPWARLEKYEYITQLSPPSTLKPRPTPINVLASELDEFLNDRDQWYNGHKYEERGKGTGEDHLALGYVCILKENKCFLGCSLGEKLTQ
jgi:hypothetical protein